LAAAHYIFIKNLIQFFNTVCTGEAWSRLGSIQEKTKRAPDFTLGPYLYGKPEMSDKTGIE